MSEETQPQQNATGRLVLPTGRARSFLLAAGLVLLTLLVYWPCMHGPFTWDDDRYVTSCRGVTEPGGIGTIWTDLVALPDAYPLTFSALWAQYRLWGNSPFGYHMVNVILHGLAAVAAWLLLRRLGLKTAWAAAFIFAVHPVHVESVAWISELKNVLSLLLGLLAAVMYLRFAGIGDEHAGKTRHCWWVYAGGLLLFILALLSKSVLCTLPVMLALMIWLTRPAELKRHVLYLLPWFAVAAGISAITAYVEHHHTSEISFLNDITFPQRIGIVFHALAFYLGKLIIPDPILVIYPKWDHTQLAAQIPYAILIIGLLVLAFLARKKFGRGPLAALLIYIIALGPTLGLINFFTMWYSFVFDHYQYLGTLAVIALGCEIARVGIAWLRVRVPTDHQQLMRYVPGAAIAGVLLVFSSLTLGYAGLWGFPEALWRFTVDHNSNAFIAYQNLAIHMTERKNFERTEPLNMRYKDQIALLERAIEIEPRDYRSYMTLAQLYNWSGDYAAATVYFRNGREKMPKRVKDRNQGFTMSSTATSQPTITDDDNVTVPLSDFSPPYLAGKSLEKLGDYAGAALRYQDALRANGRNITAGLGLGRCYAALGQYPDAVVIFKTALSFDPANKEAWRELAKVYRVVGDAKSAEAAEAKAK